MSRVKEVLKYFDPEKIYLNPDCGFGTFAERCVNTPGIAYRKLQAISEAAEILRREYALRTAAERGERKSRPRSQRENYCRS